MNGGQTPRNTILVGDALDHLRALQSGSVDQVVTSPPYFRLRYYHVSRQLGMEATIAEWVENQRSVAREIGRVLVPTGTYWLNLGDSYSTHVRQGASKKSLLLGPERLALALTRDGWVLRNKIVWHKPNPVPSSVRDRLNTAWEVIYVFAKQTDYFFDLDAIRQPHTSQPGPASAAPKRRARDFWRGPNGDDASGLDYLKAQGRVGHVLGKNPADVWSITSTGYRTGGTVKHHATFPMKLAQRMMQAGCPEARCRTCRLPWRRAVIQDIGRLAIRGALQASCTCPYDPEPGLVLDPFMGSGTTGVVAKTLRRHWLGIELNKDFADLATARIASDIVARAGPADL